MQVQGDSQIRVYQGLLNHDPYLLPSVNGVYSLVVGQYFCIELLVNQQPQLATWKGDHLDMVKEYAVSVQKARLIPCDQEVQTTLFTGVWWRSGTKLLSVSSGTQQFSLHFTVSTPLLQPVFTEVTIGQPTVGRFSIPLDKTPRTWLDLKVSSTGNCTALLSRMGLSHF